MPKSLIERAWILGGAFVALLMTVIGYFMFISPQRSETRDVRAQVSTVQQQNQLLKTRISQLAVQSKDLSKYVAAYKQADLAFPDQSGLADFLRSLQAIGNATLANVNSLTVAAPKDVAGTRRAAGTTTQNSTNAAASAAAADDAPTPTASASTAGRVYSVAITATVSGTVAQLDQFLVQLQSIQPRAVLITTLTQGDAANSASTPTSASSRVTALNVTMLAFVKPSTAAQAASLAGQTGK